jgi:DNA-binding GntR family transcriptional regulator
MSRTLAASIGDTVRKRAVRELRDRILTGSLPAGSRLDLPAICDEFGISRTPVREALLELSFEGLVEIAPRSSVTVIGITPAEVTDNFAVLAALSGKAAEWAAARIDEDTLKDLSRAAASLEHAKTGDPYNLIDANWRFHRLINEAAQSKALLSLIRQAVRLIPSNFLAVVPVEANGDQDHAELLSAIGSGLEPQAREIAERHVLAAGEALVHWLADQSADEAPRSPGSSSTALIRPAGNTADRDRP